jgi:hypothetical protein
MERLPGFRNRFRDQHQPTGLNCRIWDQLSVQLGPGSGRPEVLKQAGNLSRVLRDYIAVFDLAAFCVYPDGPVAVAPNPRTQFVSIQLGAATTGKPMSHSLIGAGLILQAVQNGTLQAKIMAKQATAERHLWRYAFMVWDRVRTGECDPWSCTLCGRDYSGLQMLSVLGIIDDPREAPLPNKSAAMALVCAPCDNVSTEDTQRGIEQTFGLVGVNTPDIRQ